MNDEHHLSLVELKLNFLNDLRIGFDSIEAFVTCTCELYKKLPPYDAKTTPYDAKTAPWNVPTRRQDPGSFMQEILSYDWAELVKISKNVSTPELKKAWFETHESVAETLRKIDANSDITERIVKFVQWGISEELSSRNVPRVCFWSEPHDVFGEIDHERIRKTFPVAESLVTLRRLDSRYDVLARMMHSPWHHGEPDYSQMYVFDVHLFEHADDEMPRIIRCSMFCKIFVMKTTSKDSPRVATITARLVDVDSIPYGDEKMDAIMTHFLWYVL